MVTTGGRRSHSALDAALDIFRVRQYFNVAVRARDVAAAAGKDARFLHTVRRAMLPLPSIPGRRRGRSSGRCAAPPRRR
jgi:hypothetical protein